ncbi:MAG: FAD:protein FMN transferase [Bacteroidales bacterium]|nr:FAD:protein FMN transferase [Bacteroidales bacterium]
MMNRKIFILSACFLCLCGCARNRYVEFKGFAQGGVYCVKADIAGVSLPVKKIGADIDSILNAIDFSLSGYNGNSLLSRRNAGEEIDEDRFLEEITALSEKYKELSNGAFDVAAAPLFDVWGFGFTSDSMPSKERIDSAMAECREGKKLNFNAIAQGYTCDVIAGYLHDIGVGSMLVDIGEIYCEGMNPSGTGWRIGIDKPEDNNQTPGASLSGEWQSDGGPHGIVTSGNYRKFYVKDGKKYSHTIDPRTGYPVTHGLLSATVVAPTAAEADALATICMVVGPEEAARMIEGLPDVEACLITSESVWKSEGF